MKRIIGTLAIAGLVIFGGTALARGGHGGPGGGHGGGHSSHGKSSGGEHYTVGHTTKAGTYVQGHWSTNPNGTKNDNYSTRGNVNPHTGEEGTKPRDGETN